MRLFVAIFPPDDVSRELRHRLTAAVDRRGVRLTPIDRWHVTLAFLGEIPAEQLPRVERALDTVTVPKGIPLRLRGGGRFGRGRSGVLWAGVDGDLAGLHANVRQQLRAADLPYDERPFTPHLTVAYTDDPALRTVLDGHVGRQWPLDAMALVRSVPGEGYTTLKSW